MCDQGHQERVALWLHVRRGPHPTPRGEAASSSRGPFTAQQSPEILSCQPSLPLRSQGHLVVSQVLSRDHLTIPEALPGARGPGSSAQRSLGLEGRRKDAREPGGHSAASSRMPPSPPRLPGQCPRSTVSARDARTAPSEAQHGRRVSQ